MSKVVTLGTIAGAVLGVLLGPRLIDLSPSLAVVVAVVLLLGGASWAVHDRERELDRDVMRRWHLRSKNPPDAPSP